ncbi:MAG: hypothetical protein A4S09_10415 [Proteobacteria bacterium SG_bin7]|nr:MAG: hypothetical protein A4S09_10415 [Proteobacteria bacterium SG_bin7]
MKSTIILGLLGMLVASLVACNNGRNSNQATQVPLPPGVGPGSMHRAGQSKSISDNGARIDSAADDIEMKNDGTYNPTDYTHVINPAAKPNSTGYTSNDSYLFVDGANDKLMQTLRNHADNRKYSQTIDNLKLDPTPHDNLRAKDLDLARSITMAEMRRSEKGHFEFRVWTQADDEIVFESPYMEDFEGEKKSRHFPLQTENSKYENTTAQCVARNVSKEKTCETVVLRLVKDTVNEAFIVFRRVPAKIFLGEYSSRLLSKYHNDNIIDKWVEFFHDVVTYQLLRKGSFNDAISVAELRTFAVVNGVSAFTLSIDRSQRGKFIVSGDMVSSLKNSSEKLNIPLQRGILAGNEDQPIDYISETVTDASILHANGRGMMEIAVQLAGGANASSNIGSDEGGVIYNNKGLTNSGRYSGNLFLRNMEMRLNFAMRTKSMRLQEKSNRAIRFTVVPVVSSVGEPDFSFSTK